MQVRVAQLLREGQGEALGERELEEDLGAFMVKLGYTMERGTLEGDVVVKEPEPEEEDEGESEGVEVGGDDGLEWQRVATVVEWTGTETRKAEESNMSTVTEVGNVVSEVSVAVAKVSDQEDFPRFAKRAKTRDFAQPAREPASSKLQFAQLVPADKSSSSKSEPAPTKVKRERVGRVPGNIETKPRSQRQMPRPEPVLVPPVGERSQVALPSPCRTMLEETRERHQKLAVLRADPGGGERVRPLLQTLLGQRTTTRRQL